MLRNLLHPTPGFIIRSLDVSQYMLNGDYAPTRIDAQYDAATMLCSSKLDQNPESTVGLLTSGGKGCVARARWPLSKLLIARAHFCVHCSV